MGGLFSSQGAVRDVDSAPPPEEEPTLPKEPPKPGKVPVYVMMPLDWMNDDASALRNEAELREQLSKLKQAGLRGVMADVWWGLCEPQAGNYRFGAAVALCKALKDVGLHFQAVMSFHQCGGNVGDEVTIPLPEWVMKPARDKGLLYRTRSGVTSTDCLSLSADREGIFEGKDGSRNALQCFRDFMAAFVSACGEFMGTTVVEVQVGCGPCGELRYPSYMLSNGWEYPGVGLVTAHDAGMLKMLKAATSQDAPPGDLPDEQNSMPEASPFWKASGDAFREGEGKSFLAWYSRVLVEHGAAVMREAVKAIVEGGYKGAPTDLALSVKVSGLHWHVMHPSRATEASAGYDCCSSDHADAYRAIAGMLKEVAKESGHPVLFNFTCMEMNNWSNSMPHSNSAPEDLIAQVRRICVQQGVPLCGENALGFDPASGGWAFDQMKKQARGWSEVGDRMHGLTLLRLDSNFVSNRSLVQLRKFTEEI